MTLGFKLVLHVFTQMMCPARGEIQAIPAADLPSCLCSQPDEGFLARKTRFIARADTVSRSSELADDYSVDTAQEAAAAARQHPHRGRPSATSSGWLCRTGCCLPSLLPPCCTQHRAGSVSHIGDCSYSWLLLVPSVCFLNNPCRICVLAG